MYTLLTGNIPFTFNRNDSHEFILARTSHKLPFTEPAWNRITYNAKVIHSIEILFLIQK